MKKLLALLLTFALCLSVATALAADYTVDGWFTITYDDSFVPDSTTYADENTDEVRWLLQLQQGNTIIDVTMETLMDYPDFSLSTATDEQRQTYVDETLSAFADEDITLIDSLTVSDQNIPFYVYTLTDEEELYYLAETVIDGYALDFYAYYEDNTDADDALLLQLETIVSTFILKK